MQRLKEERQEEILAILASQKTVSAGDTLQALSNQPAERTLRDDLAKLKKLDLITTSGKGRGANWFVVNKNKAAALIATI